MYYLKRLLFFSVLIYHYFLFYFCEFKLLYCNKKKDVVQLLGSDFKFKVLSSLIIFIGIIIILLFLNYIFTQKVKKISIKTLKYHTQIIIS